MANHDFAIAEISNCFLSYRLVFVNYHGHIVLIGRTKTVNRKSIIYGATNNVEIILC